MWDHVDFQALSADLQEAMQKAQLLQPLLRDQQLEKVKQTLLQQLQNADPKQAEQMQKQEDLKNQLKEQLREKLQNQAEIPHLTVQDTEAVTADVFLEHGLWLCVMEADGNCGYRSLAVARTGWVCELKGHRLLSCPTTSLSPHSTIR